MTDYLINTEYTLDEVIQDICAHYEQGGAIKVKVTPVRNRTLSQNDPESLHVEHDAGW